MSEKKLITVFGATGMAGGSVAKYLLEDGTFAVRAVTRNATSAAAAALKAKGAEVVEADMDKPETLAGAVAGAYGVLGMTDFWTLLPGTGWSVAKAQELEEVQGRAVVDAAKAAGVKHFVFLSLPDGDCPHFAGKAKIARYLAESGLPYTTLVTSIYYENISAPFERNFMFGRNEDGSLVVKVPHPADSSITLYSVEQTGGWVLAVLKNSEQWLGKELWVIGDRTKTSKIAEVLSKAIGKPVGVRALTTDEFYAAGNTTNVVAKEIHDMMRVVHEHFQLPDELYVESASASVYPEQQDFETFVRENENFKKFLATL